MYLLHLIVAASATHMPDAMETIYEKALAYGKSGGVSKTVSIDKKSWDFCWKLPPRPAGSVSLGYSVWVVRFHINLTEVTRNKSSVRYSVSLVFENPTKVLILV